MATPTSTNPHVITVLHLLSHATDPTTTARLVSPTATYTSLNNTNPPLKLIMPWCGSHPSTGPSAITETFINVGRYWSAEDFSVEAAFGAENNVAVFGHFTYRSKRLGKGVTSPFAVWCKMDGEGRVEEMLFMEDTLATSESFKREGRCVYESDPEGGSVVVE